MNAMRALPPCAVVAATALFLTAEHGAQAFNPQGFFLSFDQRTYRVHNAFTAPPANDNTTPDPNFPGSLGATLAIRKAAAEWGSGTYGDGTGDPTQIQIGDGGANLDFFFAGEVDTAPGANGNTVTVLQSGCTPGTLAFTQPSNTGWTITFCEEEGTFDDQPGTINSQYYDIQSIAAQGFGFALGLGPSNVNNATMGSGIFNGAVTKRSIHPDDQAGVQFIYGTKAPDKPEITSVSVGLDTITITGLNFPPTGNDIWFTNPSPAPKTALIISDVSSTNGGTEITIAIPAGAASGDILVDRGVFGVGRLSNAFPIDLTPANPGTYCTGKVNSAGFAPVMGSSGMPSLGDNDFSINVNTALPQKNMLFFEGSGQAAIPFFNGTLCTAPPLKRGPIQTTDFLGFASLPIPFLPADVGTQHNLQAWLRDPQAADGTGVALSNAIQYVVLP